ncbi:MAG: hypothetical protein ACRCTL_04780 [Pseudomonas sp.]
MPLIARHTKLIMLITGVLTCTMFYNVVAPQAALLSMFGTTLGGSALSEILTRSWGMLITLVGAMLIYGAFNPAVRPLVLVVAGLSKLLFVALLLLLGGEFLPKTLPPIIIDSLAVLLYALCLPPAHRAAMAS